MPDRALCLLDEPLIRVRLGGGTAASATLPEILARLGATDQVADFPGIRAHQVHPWHAFLVQLAAIALQRAGAADPGVDPERWRALLCDVTDGDSRAYCLVVDDLSAPAFMQPPVPEGTLDGLKSIAQSPDGIDTLLTARNHDVKRACAVAAFPDQWAFALLTLQTTEGFAGRDNYGIVRMNGGHGSRPFVGFAPSLRPGPRFQRDLAVVLDARAGIAEAFGYRTRGGKALLWLEPWDGTRSLALSELDPLFIEICRRVRLVSSSDGLHARIGTTKVSRIDAGEIKGVTGDPWTPVDRTAGKALTVPRAAFDYRRTQDLLFGGTFDRPPAQQLRDDDPETMIFVAAVLARGQGKTEGYHERQLRLTPRIRRVLGCSAPSELERLGDRSRRRVEEARAARRQVLNPALLALIQAGPDKLDYRDDRTERFGERFERRIDAIFFERLFRDVDAPDEQADRAWQRELIAEARVVLDEAIGAVPLPSVRKYRAISAATRMFGAMARKTYPDLYEPDDQQEGSAQ